MNKDRSCEKSKPRPILIHYISFDRRTAFGRFLTFGQSQKACAVPLCYTSSMQYARVGGGGDSDGLPQSESANSETRAAQCPIAGRILCQAVSQCKARPSQGHPDSVEKPMSPSSPPPSVLTRDLSLTEPGQLQIICH